MTVSILALILLAAAGLGMIGARGLLGLKSNHAFWVSGGVCAGYVLILLWRPDVPWVPNLSVLIAGSCLGFLFGHLLGSSASVLAFLFTAAIVDYLSFSDGLTNQILEAYRAGNSTILSFLAVFVEIGGREYAVIGVSDIAILAAAFVGFRRATSLSWEPAVWLLLGLASAFAVGVLFNGAPGIPFLAVAGMIFVFRNGRRMAH